MDTPKSNYDYIKTLQALGRASAELSIFRVMLRYAAINTRILALQAEITTFAHNRNPIIAREALRILNLKLDAWQAEEKELTNAQTRRINANSNLNQFLRNGGAS